MAWDKTAKSFIIINLRAILAFKPVFNKKGAFFDEKTICFREDSEINPHPVVVPELHHITVQRHVVSYEFCVGSSTKKNIIRRTTHSLIGTLRSSIRG